MTALLAATLLASMSADVPLDVEAEVTVAASSEGRHRAIASRSIEAGDLQYPWLLRVDPDGTLVAGVNTRGTEIALCRSVQPLPTGRRVSVGFHYDGAMIVLRLAGDEVQRCAAEGEVPRARGRLVLGLVRNVPNPSPLGPDHQRFAGTLWDVRTTEPGPDGEPLTSAAALAPQQRPTRR
jgi:hypothetical protein